MTSLECSPKLKIGDVCRVRAIPSDAFLHEVDTTGVGSLAVLTKYITCTGVVYRYTPTEHCHAYKIAFFHRCEENFKNSSVAEQMFDTLLKYCDFMPDKKVIRFGVTLPESVLEKVGEDDAVFIRNDFVMAIDKVEEMRSLSIKDRSATKMMGTKFTRLGHIKAVDVVSGEYTVKFGNDGEQVVAVLSMVPLYHVCAINKPFIVNVPTSAGPVSVHCWATCYRKGTKKVALSSKPLNTKKVQLMAVCRSGDYDKAFEILSMDPALGGSTIATDADQYPLVAAIKSNGVRVQLELVALLLACGARTDNCDADGNTALMIAATETAKEGDVGNSTNLFKLLLACGRSGNEVNRRDCMDRSILHLTVMNANVALFEELIRHPNVDVNAVDADNFTVVEFLTREAMNGCPVRLHMLHLLCQHPALAIEKCRLQLRTIAIEFRTIDVMIELCTLRVFRRSLIEQVNGYTAMQQAIRSGCTSEMLAVILQYTPSSPSTSGRLDCMIHPTGEGDTPLHLAVHAFDALSASNMGHVAFANIIYLLAFQKRLFNTGQIVSMEARNQNNVTALDLAFHQLEQRINTHGPVDPHLVANVETAELDHFQVENAIDCIKMCGPHPEVAVVTALLAHRTLVVDAQQLVIPTQLSLVRGYECSWLKCCGQYVEPVVQPPPVIQQQQPVVQQSTSSEGQGGKTCKICYNEKVEWAALNCGFFHVVCMVCADKVVQSAIGCPFCRNAVTKFDRLLFP